MTSLFPVSPAFDGHNAPSRLECDVYDLEIDGELPAEISGTWYRCGPDPQYPPYLGDDIFINGDGMISMFRIEDGHVDFKMRYIKTDRWKAERKARRSLYGKYRNPWTDAPEVQGQSRGTANTSPVWHGGRLLALKEDHVPMQIDPETLDTIGQFTWNGKLRSKTVTAHPKIDPETGDLFLFGYECEGDGSSSMCFLVEDSAGNLVREDWFEPPYVAMVHDFAITKDYVIFPIMPTTMDPERLKSGGDHWKWDGSLPCWVGIMPRAGSVEDLRWFKVPTAFAFHAVNAFNEGTTVHLDMMVAKRNAFPFIGDITGMPVNIEEGMPFATRWTFDMTSNHDDGGLKTRQLAGFPGELPIVDARRIGKDYRYTYVGMIDPERPMHAAGPMAVGFNMLGKVDITTGALDPFHGTDEMTFQEGCFVPRGVDEDDGWFITIADLHDQNRSDMLVFDAKKMGDGPVATARLPFRLRTGIHTTWVPARSG